LNNGVASDYQEFDSITTACVGLKCNRKFFEKHILYERLYPEGYWAEIMTKEELKVIAVRKKYKKDRENGVLLIRLPGLTA
jgi:hypothetical protein